MKFAYLLTLTDDFTLVHSFTQLFYTQNKKLYYLKTNYLIKIHIKHEICLLINSHTLVHI
jgi:hypothetical protein